MVTQRVKLLVFGLKGYLVWFLQTFSHFLSLDDGAIRQLLDRINLGQAQTAGRFVLLLTEALQKRWQNNGDET